MTDTLITILMVFFADYHIEAEYDTRSGCGAALLELAASDLSFTHATCAPTYAPSVSLLPMVRP
jgi:hypothetical protein